MITTDTAALIHYVIYYHNNVFVVCPVFGKEFYKLGSSIAAMSKTFSLDTHKGT